MRLAILHEDEDIIVVDKPSGLLSIPDRFDAGAPSLSELLKERCGEIFVCHRIDRDTSGAIVFAKHAEAHAWLNRQFESHSVMKRYEAIVDGAVAPPSSSIELPIGQHHKHKGMMVVDAIHGKPAVTHYEVLKQFREFAHCSIKLETGRQHQIRVHFAAIGHPLMVDPLYGKRTAFLLSSVKKNYRGAENERPLIDRLTLHAIDLQFTHPRSNDIVHVSAPLPKDMIAVLKQLERWNL